MAMEWIRSQAEAARREVHTLYRCGRDPRVPWYAKALILVVIAYALSPIDLIPDFIPVLGLLDDILLVPLGVWLAIRLIPVEVHAEHRAAIAAAPPAAIGRWGAAIVVTGWVAILITLGVLLIL